MDYFDAVFMSSIATDDAVAHYIVKYLEIFISLMPCSSVVYLQMMPQCIYLVKYMEYFDAVFKLFPIDIWITNAKVYDAVV
jgi:hypothetical protein